MQILGSLFPAGLGAAIGTALGWFFNRRLSKARNSGDVDAAYMDNIQNLRSDLMSSINENRKLYRAIARLDRTVARATACRHWNDCRSPGRLTRNSLVTDSLQGRSGFALLQQPVPPSVARTAFPTKILTSIPVGTGFSKRSGQATVNVNRISEDSLEVTATCDSLARQVIMLTEELTRIRNETSSAVETLPPEVIREPTGWQWFQIWTGRLAVAVLLLILIKRRLNRT